MQKVAIIGLGLIGGSVGLGLSAWSKANGDGGQALQLVGFDTDIQQQQYAKKINVVEKTEWDLTRAVRDADIVILCVPVSATEQTFRDIADHLKPGAIVTDTASTKADVLRWAGELLPRTVHFVGGHPMAGKAQSIEGAEATLFKGATWCVCPSVRASEDAIKNVLGIIGALEAEPYFVDPEEHDAHVAGVSHLPFVLSAALMRATSKDTSWRDMRSLSATGFRDMTRLASGSPAMHRDITLTNRESVTRWVDAMVVELGDFRKQLNGEAPEAAMEEYFMSAREARADWATQTHREGELVQDTDSELAGASMSGQMGRLFFGSLLSRRRSIERPTSRDDGRASKTPGRADRA